MNQVVGILLLIVAVIVAGVIYTESTTVEKCNTETGIITARTTVPDPSGWGHVRYTITINNTSVYEVGETTFVKTRIGDTKSMSMCWREGK